MTETLRIVRVESEGERAEFLELPQRLYPRQHLPQDRKLEEALLEGSHTLSGLMGFQAYLVYDQDLPIMRAAMTYYENRNDAYLGFFEGENRPDAMQLLVETVAQAARERGYAALVGPVQASFWLGYRMQLTGMEDLPFTGEPHNLPYYENLWRQAGFELQDRYLSTFYDKIPADEMREKMARRLARFEKKGYVFRSPKKEEWPEVSRQVHVLLEELYQDFPVYQSLPAESFADMFASYREILDFSMVHLAYKDGELQGFMITVPDYANLVYQNLTPWTLARILWRKFHPKQYLLLYLGAREPGLGAALSYLSFLQVKARGSFAVGALIHESGPAQNYAKHLRLKIHEYGLWRLSL